MSLARRFARGFGVVFAADTLRLLSMGVLILLLTRILLTPEEYGLFFLAMAVLSVATLFSRLGLDKSAARYLTEYREHDPGQLPHILRRTLQFSLLAIAVVGTALVASSGVIGRALGDPRLVGLLIVGAGFVGAQTLSSMFVTLFQGLNRVQLSALLRAVESVVRPVLVVVFVFSGLGVIGVLLGYTAGVVAAAGVGLALLYFRFYRRYDRADVMEPGLTRRLLRYSVPLTATRGANELDKRVDTIMVGYFLDPVAVAYYTLAKQLSDFVIAPASSLGFTVSPAYGELKAQEDLRQAGRVYETALVYTLALYLPAVAGLVLVADPAVRFVFGSGYLGAIPVIQLFSLYILVFAIDKITSDGLDFLGRARVRAMAKGSSSLANFGLNLVLIPVFGVIGAAAATVVTTTALVAVELAVVYRELPLRWRWVLVRLGLVLGVTAGLALLVGALVPHISGLVSLAGVVVLTVVVWAVLMTASGIVEPVWLRSLR